MSEAAIEVCEASPAPAHHCDGKVRAIITTIVGRDQEVARWVLERLPDIADFGPCTAIGVARNQQPVAGVVYNNYHRGLNGSGPMVEGTIVATDPRFLTRGVIRALLAYPFCQLGARRFQVTVAKRNKRARKFIERLGFVYEGTGRRAWSDARDACVYSMLPEEAVKWLGEDVNGKISA